MEDHYDDNDNDDEGKDEKNGHGIAIRYDTIHQTTIGLD